MGKDKYLFNTTSLQVEKVRESFRDKVRTYFRFILAGALISTLLLITGFLFIDSPKEKALRREIRQYELQYQLINDRLDVLTAVMEDMQERDDHIYRVIFEAEPIPRAVREAAVGGTDRYARFEGYDNTRLISSTMQRLDQMARQLYVQSRSYDEVFEMALNKADMLAAIPAIVPIANGTERLMSGFGHRIHPIYKTLRMHTGVDFTAPTGTPIYATGNGVVVRAYRNNHGYGRMVLIDHGYGYQTLYAHMSQIDVRQGQQVVRGEVIGLVGSTGISTAPHLHYEVIRNGRKVNPVNYFFNDLSPEEYEYIIEVASRVNQSLS